MIKNGFIKRFFGLTVAIPSVIFLSFVLALIGFMVRIKIGAPVLFLQVRPGSHGKPFTIYKFRTMADERDENDDVLQDADRLTPLGRFLRKTSMDELPEFFNVVKGDISSWLMSFTNEIFGIIYSRASPTPRGKAWDYRLGTGERTQCDKLIRK
jgi:lipopolysaccharide/colanic/teichoic acid biosynthesis glycosyltransferase